MKSKGLRDSVRDEGCDVNGCSGRTFMGWRPLTEKIGRKVCEDHWLRHRDGQDGFDLFEAFGFRRPQPKQDTAPRVRKLSLRRYCRECGQPRQAGHRYCDACGKKRKLQSNQRRQQRFRDRKRNAFALTRPGVGSDCVRPVGRL
ncbi:MAG: hypothetical protein ACYSW8_06520 [Planctomycetota bacterium]